MPDIKLFRVVEGGVHLLPSSSVAIEKSLQTLVERHLEVFLGVRFLASEFSTTKSHGGRIDTLGIDDTNSPVIIEYKRALNENVINQGLFYLNWLMDHQADFTLLVMKQLGAESANSIEWRYPRLVCVAGDFTKYDEHAIREMPRNIDLIRYRRYGDDLILLEQVASSSVSPLGQDGKSQPKPGKPVGTEPSPIPIVLQRLNQSSQEVRDWFDTLKAFILGLGDDIEERTLYGYIAFRHLKTFADVRFRPTLNRIVIGVPLAAETVQMEKGFTSPLKGNRVKIEVDSAADIERAQSLISRAYQET